MNNNALIPTIGVVKAIRRDTPRLHQDLSRHQLLRALDPRPDSVVRDHHGDLLRRRQLHPEPLLLRPLLLRHRWQRGGLGALRGTFAVGALKGDGKTMDVRAKDIRLGSANLTLGGAGSIVADKEFSVNDFYYRGYSYGTLDIRAARQAGTIASLGTYDGDLTFTIAEGDFRAAAAIPSPRAPKIAATTSLNDQYRWPQ